MVSIMTRLVALLVVVLVISQNATLPAAIVIAPNPRVSAIRQRLVCAANRRSNTTSIPVVAAVTLCRRWRWARTSVLKGLLHELPPHAQWQVAHIDALALRAATDTDPP